MNPRMVKLGGVVTLALILPAAALLRRPREVPGLRAAEGLDAVVFAQSPMLTNPTDLDVDSRGRVWVTEGYNYRNQLHPENPVREAGDRVLILEDTDGDGKADSRKVYYQGRDVDAAMGIAVFGNQVIVSAYSKVFLFTDEDGDDRPDRKEVLFTFGDEISDHGVHAFVFGPDGRFYFNVGNASRKVMDPQGNPMRDPAGNAVESTGKPYRQGMTFRTNLDRSGFEVLGDNFRNPYEVALDSYGTVWQSDNDDDGNRSTRVNYVMEYGNYGYTDEMTGAGWSAYRTGMEEEIPRRHWHQADPGVVPNLLITGAGAPSGITVYEGSLLPEVYRGALIHAEAGNNVVRAYPTAPEGAGYRARILEILKATTDAMFRPVDVAVAPDGSLFVADWYDPGVGGHDVGDLDHGRIIRVAPRGAAYRPKRPDLSTPESAAAALESPNLATRFLAYRRLEGWKERAEPALAKLWRSADPKMRARALWLLAELPGAGARYLDRALGDRDPDLRITALRAIRRNGTEVVPAARRLVRDPSPQVRREVAIALRGDASPEAASLWAELARQYDGRDRWYLEALGIGAEGQWDRFLAAWRQAVGDGWKQPAGRDIVWRARNDAALPMLAELIRDPSVTKEEELRYFRAMDFHPGEARQKVLLGLLDDAASPRRTALVLAALDTSAVARPEVRRALSRTLDATRGTQQYLELARRFDTAERADEMLRLALAQPDGSTGVEAARLVLRWKGVEPFRGLIRGSDADAAYRAVSALGRAGGSEAEKVLEGIVVDASLPLGLRSEAVRLWGPGWSAQGELLKLAQEGKLADDLRPTVAQVLLLSYRPQTRAAAEKLFGALSATTSEGRPVDAAALALRSGDAARGRAVFQRSCSTCHVAEGTATGFGPGLSRIGEKLPEEALYTAILHPSAGIAFGYEGTVLKLKDGSEAAGIVASETADELVLRRPGGLATRYRPAEIASRTRMDRSLMPEGLSGTMTEQELVDLVEYLTTLRGN
jgi:putative membrane-bound dehydrogenase-like protein